MRKALVLFDTPSIRQRMQVNGMKADFSWGQTAARYVEVYESARK